MPYTREELEKTMDTWLKANPVVKPLKLNNPELPGMAGNPGLA